MAVCQVLCHDSILHRGIAARAPSELYCLWRGSSETVSFFLPLARLRASKARPDAVAILFLNPCLLLRFLCEG